MKRYNNLFDKIVNLDNLRLADRKARRGKANKIDIINFDKEKEINILELYDSLKNKSYTTSEYYTFSIYEPKHRVISKLPYKDRVVQWTIINILESLFVSTYTSDTYSCIKKRGILLCFNKLRKALKDKQNTQYCLKLDIQKFYPSITNSILKKLLRKKFKDKDLLWLLDDIIDSNIGCPLGNLMSQYFANFYICYFLHYLKEIEKVKYIFCYCDDIVILSNSKQDLKLLLDKIIKYLDIELKLVVKSNHRIFPTYLGINFLGYVFYLDYTKLRPSIKKKFIRMCRYNMNNKSLGCYWGWICHCNGINLWNKYVKNNKQIKTKNYESNK